MNKTAIIRNPIFKLHNNGNGHPESSERLCVIDEMLENFPFKDYLIDIPSNKAGFADLNRIHTDNYIKQIESTSGIAFTRLDADTSACKDSYTAALHAAGGTIDAVKAVFDGIAESAFSFVRPPGHHAESDRAMGFCLFNNAAVAAEFALNHYNLNRVLILDWDVHHGNGTMHSFYDTDRIMYFSIHQYPHYPGTGSITDTGAGKGAGFTINAPVESGCGDEEYQLIFRELFEPVVSEFSPELIIVSAGFDAHRLDPLANILLTSGAYGRMTNSVLNTAAGCGDCKTVFVLEGGYDFTALTEGIFEVLNVLTNWNKNSRVPSNRSASDLSYLKTISLIKNRLKGCWNSLSDT